MSRKSRRRATSVGTEHTAEQPANVTTTEQATETQAEQGQASTTAESAAAPSTPPEPSAPPASEQPAGETDAPAASTAPAETPVDPASDGEEQPETEKVPTLEALALPIKMLLAAAMCGTTDSGGRRYMEGVFIHQHDDTVRICGSDGSRMLVSSYKLPKRETMPAWAKTGLVLPIDGLKARLGLIGNAANYATLSWAVGYPTCELSDAIGECVFRVRPIDEKWPDYDRIIKSMTAALSQVGQAVDLAGVGFNAKLFKGLGDIAKVLADKGTAPTIALYSANTSEKDEQHQASIVTFPYAPGVVYYLMPVRLADSMAPETVAILQPAIRSSLAALRAHRTRNEQAMKAATSEEEKARYREAADAFKVRIERILAVSSGKALPAPSTPPAEQPAGDKPANDQPQAIAPARIERGMKSVKAAGRRPKATSKSAARRQRKQAAKAKGNGSVTAHV